MTLRWTYLLMTLATATACSSRMPHLQSSDTLTATPSTQASGIINGKMSLSTDIGVASTVGIIETDDLMLDANKQIVGFGQTRVLCTGVLIAEDTVLTAAHCEQTQLKYQFIIFSRDLTNWTQSDARQVWQAQQEPTWAKAQMGGTLSTAGVDLAIMRFKGGIPSGYSPVSIYEGQPLNVGTPVMVYGYGVTDINSPSTAGTLRSTMLQMIRPPVEKRTLTVGATDLTDTVASTLRADQFNLPSLVSGVCIGDSGGPVYDLAAGGQVLLVGITSGGFGSTATDAKFAQCHTYSTHTYVYPYEQWIAQTVMQMRGDKKIGSLSGGADDDDDGGGTAYAPPADGGKKHKKDKAK